ncbi:hypothetical protein U14_05337 [Candidatus Moduliflexus flocculans]|uniref:Uncharacterized protein n=1 Tax=Candidatus Moduliflexus flocculans TaxID=1499966 RepID=A0A081BRM9_9BACT|nr:hypothetical protein U14_05337 [Candidatus Moduliflexus flocculans]
MGALHPILSARVEAFIKFLKFCLTQPPYNYYKVVDKNKYGNYTGIIF